MKTPNPDVDSFIEALRGDFPSAGDEARVRSRLLTAGVLVTSAAVTTSAAVAAPRSVARRWERRSRAPRALRWCW